MFNQKQHKLLALTLVVLALLTGLYFAPARTSAPPKRDLATPEGVALHVIDLSTRHKYEKAWDFITFAPGSSTPLSRSDDPRPYLGVPGDCVINEQEEIQVEENLVRVPLMCGETDPNERYFLHPLQVNQEPKLIVSADFSWEAHT